MRSITRGGVAADRTRAVRTAIVAQHQLHGERRPLRQHPFDRPADVGRMVVGGHADRYEGGGRDAPRRRRRGRIENRYHRFVNLANFASRVFSPYSSKTTTRHDRPPAFRYARSPRTRTWDARPARRRHSPTPRRSLRRVPLRRPAAANSPAQRGVAAQGAGRRNPSRPARRTKGRRSPAANRRNRLRPVRRTKISHRRRRGCRPPARC